MHGRRITNMNTEGLQNLNSLYSSVSLGNMQRQSNGRIW